MSVTLRDIAEAAGVSVTTASYVLNDRGSISEETRNKVKKAIQALEYRRQGRGSGHLVLVNGAVGTLTSCLHQAVAEFGFELHKTSWDRNIATPPTLDGVPRVAGVLLYGGLWNDKLVAQTARTYPTVSIGGFVSNLHGDSVWVDNAAGMYQATTSLINLGHRHIGLLNGPTKSPNSAEKQAGFERALRNAPFDVRGAVVEAPGYSRCECLEAARDLLYRTVSAIVAADTGPGLAVLDACRERSLRVPEDISLIVFRDDTSFAGELQITVIDIPEMAIAREAVSLLIRRIERPLLPGRRVLIQPKLIERASTSPHRAPRNGESRHAH